VTRPTDVSTRDLSTKIRNTLAKSEIKGLARHSVKWVYWNGQVYRILPPHHIRHARQFYKYAKPIKKYGIQDPILVYQMGKVGSTSILNALRAYDLDVPVYQIHHLNKLDKYEARAQQFPERTQGMQQMLARSRAILREMRQSPTKKWNLISLVRAPIPQVVSAFFQDLDVLFPDYVAMTARGELTSAKLVEYFLREYRNETPLHWFDVQLRDVLGLDVYAQPFPISQGYQIYSFKNLRLLVMRLEDLERCAAPAMREFLRIPHFQLAQENSGAQKAYAQLYRDFRAQLRLPAEFVHKYNDSRYAQHFYTASELAASVAPWTR
jgi:hypothetical protein